MMHPVVLMTMYNRVRLLFALLDKAEVLDSGCKTFICYLDLKKVLCVDRTISQRTRKQYYITQYTAKEHSMLVPLFSNQLGSKLSNCALALVAQFSITSWRD